MVTKKLRKTRDREEVFPVLVDGESKRREESLRKERTKQARKKQNGALEAERDRER